MIPNINTARAPSCCGIAVSDPKADPVAGYAKGHLKFELDGDKLHGGWTLVRTEGSKYGGKTGKQAWLLIKERDAYARPNDTPIVDSAPDSVASGRSAEQIAAARAHVWESKLSVKENVRAGAIASSSRKRAAKTVRDTADNPKAGTRRKMPQGAKAAKLPAMVAPMLTTLVSKAPAGEEWIHEIKYDGYRMVCRIDGGKAHLYSRNGKDWTSSFHSVADD